jgi:hypothetical protein
MHFETIFLPRQARDKNEEKLEKSTGFFSQTVTDGDKSTTSMETVADEATLIKEANLSLGAQTRHYCIYYTKDGLLQPATQTQLNSTQPSDRQPARPLGSHIAPLPNYHLIAFLLCVCRPAAVLQLRLTRTYCPRCSPPMAPPPRMASPAWMTSSSYPR